MRRFIHHNEKSVKAIDWLMGGKIILGFLVWLKTERVYLQIFWSGDRRYPKYGSTNHFKHFCYRLRFVSVTDKKIEDKTYFKYDFMLNSETSYYTYLFREVDLMFIIKKLVKYLTVKKICY